MIPLTKLQKSQIKGWMQEESYAAVFQFYKNRIEEIRAEEITGQDSFQTLKALHKKQGREEVLQEFFNDLDRQAYE